MKTREQQLEEALELLIDYTEDLLIQLDSQIDLTDVEELEHANQILYGDS